MNSASSRPWVRERRWWPASGLKGEGNTDIGIVSRPHPGFLENGDAYVIRWPEDHVLLLALIDALGHGPEAEVVAQKAVGFLSSSRLEQPAELLRGCHHALQGTRGAAAALARIDLASDRLSYCGVGNIEARLVGRTEARLISYNGIVGSILPNFRVFDFPLGFGDLLFLHSDGISARFDLGTYPNLTGQPAQLIAEAIASKWTRLQDDATILVVRYAKDRGES